MRGEAGPRVERVDGRAIVRVAGDVDLANAAALRDASLAAAADETALVVVLDDVTYLDSAGIHVLDGLRAALRSRGVALALVAAPGVPVRRSLELAGMGRLLPLCATLDEALGGGTP